MKLSVLVPTYRRVKSLERCLHGLHTQTRLADEVLIIVQESDEETRNLLENWTFWPELRMVVTTKVGQVSQMNVGLDVLSGDIVAFTDDDAVPRPDWLANIEKHFASDAGLGGVGGRDYVEENGVKLIGEKYLIGTVQWFGRIAGNHHLGACVVPEVDYLKGVNMSFRMAAVGNLRFDVDLRGEGAQTGNDWAFSLAINKKGWRLLYDPAVAVDHYPAVRFDENQRGAPTLQAIEDSAFNEYLSILRHMRPGSRRFTALSWMWLIGIRNNPGALRGVVFLLKGDQAGRQKRAASKRAWQAARKKFRGVKQP